MRCKTCHASGNIMTFDGRPEFWPCPACGGAGARFQFGPPTVHIHAIKSRATPAPIEPAGRPRKEG